MMPDQKPLDPQETRAIAIARLRAGDRPAVVSRALKFHPQTVYAWQRAERVKKYELLTSLVALAASLQGWTGNPGDLPAMRLRRDRLCAGLRELQGNLL